MGNLYQWLMFGHVLAAMVWLGGLVTLTAFGMRARHSGDRDTVARFVGNLRVIGPIVLAPSALLVVAFGVWMVIKSPSWDFGQTWVSLAFALFIAAVLIGAVYLSRTGLAAERAVKAGDHDEAARHLARWSWGIRVIVLLLVIATWDMVIKPGV